MLLRGIDLENSGQRGCTVGKQEAAGGGREVVVGMSLGADGGALVAVMCSLRIYTRPPSANQSRLFVCHSQATYHGGISVVYTTVVYRGIHCRVIFILASVMWSAIGAVAPGDTTTTEYHGAAKRL